MKNQFDIDTLKMEWEKLREGAYIKHLAKDSKNGMQYDIFKIDAGMKFPPHEHLSYEWVYVLEGVFEDENGKYPKGTFLQNDKGSQHASGSSVGCEIIVLWGGKHKYLNES